MTDAPRYQPEVYWNKRRHPNTQADAPITGADQNFFYPLIRAASSILEIGPGVGRLFPLYTSHGAITTLDVSKNYASRARAAADAAGVAVQAAYVERADQRYPFADATFDLGVTALVFQHIPFDTIAHAMTEAARVCDRVAVRCSINTQWPKRGDAFDPQAHCFLHDYPALCRELGLTLMLYDDRSSGSVNVVYTRRRASRIFPRARR